MDKKKLNPKIGMAKARIEALNDGVFAIAMTLLILNIELPKGRHSLSEIQGFFVYSLSEFFDYGLSFILLAFFWTAQHRQFHWLERVDDKLLWLNILLLLSIVVIPLSTALFGDYRFFWPTAVFINVNLSIVLLILFTMWSYARSHPELHSTNVADEHIIFSRSPVLLLIPLMSVTAIGLSFIVPAWSTIPFVFVPFLMTRRMHEVAA